MRVYISPGLLLFEYLGDSCELIITDFVLSYNAGVLDYPDRNNKIIPINSPKIWFHTDNRPFSPWHRCVVQKRKDSCKFGSGFRCLFYFQRIKDAVMLQYNVNFFGIRIKIQSPTLQIPLNKSSCHCHPSILSRRCRHCCFHPISSAGYCRRR